MLKTEEYNCVFQHACYLEFQWTWIIHGSYHLGRPDKEHRFLVIHSIHPFPRSNITSYLTPPPCLCHRSPRGRKHTTSHSDTTSLTFPVTPRAAHLAQFRSNRLQRTNDYLRKKRRRSLRQQIVPYFSFSACVGRAGAPAAERQKPAARTWSQGKGNSLGQKSQLSTWVL